MQWPSRLNLQTLMQGEGSLVIRSLQGRFAHWLGSFGQDQLTRTGDPQSIDLPVQNDMRNLSALGQCHRFMRGGVILWQGLAGGHRCVLHCGRAWQLWDQADGQRVNR